jgi:hypothetical protein
MSIFIQRYNQIYSQPETSVFCSYIPFFYHFFKISIHIPKLRNLIPDDTVKIFIDHHDLVSAILFFHTYPGVK